MNAPLRPTRVATRPTPVGATLAAATVAMFLYAWFGGGVGFSALAVLGGAVTIVAAASSRRHASSLRVATPEPVTAFSGERFVLGVSVANLARRAGAFDVLFTLDSTLPGGWRVAAMLPRLPAGRETRLDLAHPSLRRGLHRQGTLELASAFPLGLWTCRLRFELPHEILVLPRLGTLRRAPRPADVARAGSGHGGAARGDEQEVWGIRERRDGEGLRSVHWKLSARRGRLLVREFRSEPLPPVHVVLATGLDQDTRKRRDSFEDAVSLAATLVEHHAQIGHPVRLTILGAGRRTVACRSGRGALFPVLRALSQVAPEFGIVAASAAATPPRGRPGERVYLVRVASGAPRPRIAGDVVVFDVDGADVASVFDRRRRPGSTLLVGARS